MKKIYAKPEVAFENFTMSTNIAAGCHFITKLPAEGIACGFKPSDRWSEPIMLNNEHGCGATPPAEYDRVCYNVPDENFDLFNS